MTCGSGVCWSALNLNELVSDEQFLEVAGLDWTSKKPNSLRLVEVGAVFGWHSHCGDLQPTQDSGHVKSHGLDTRFLRHVTQLLGPECSDERRTSVRVLANRTTSAVSWIAKVQGVHGQWTDETRSSREQLKLD